MVVVLLFINCKSNHEERTKPTNKCKEAMANNERLTRDLDHANEEIEKLKSKFSSMRIVHDKLVTQLKGFDDRVLFKKAVMSISERRFEDAEKNLSEIINLHPKSDLRKASEKKIKAVKKEIQKKLQQEEAEKRKRAREEKKREKMKKMDSLRMIQICVDIEKYKGEELIKNVTCPYGIIEPNFRELSYDKYASTCQVNSPTDVIVYYSRSAMRKVVSALPAEQGFSYRGRFRILGRVKSSGTTLALRFLDFANK